jgi:hypothetical protein
MSSDQQLVSQPDHGENIIDVLNGNRGVASPRLQIFFDDITRLLGDLAGAGGGSIDPSDFSPSSIIYRPSTGTDILPAVIEENEFLGRLPGGEIQGLGFVDAWSILGNGTTNITINNTSSAVDFTVESNTSSRMFVVQGSNNRVSIARNGLAGTDGTVHILNKSAGVVTAAADGSTLVLEDEFEGGMSILNGSNATGNLYFGGPAYGEKAGNLWFWHDTDTTLPRMGIDVREKTYLEIIDTQGALFNPDQDTDIDFQINTLGTAPFLFIDSANNRMGLTNISALPTDGILHITKDSVVVGASAPSWANSIVIERESVVSGGQGMSFVNDAIGQGRINWALPGNDARATFQYNHFIDEFQWYFDTLTFFAMSLSPLVGFTFNNGQEPAWDFRLQSQGSTSMFFMDSSAGRVGIGNSNLLPTGGLFSVRAGNVGVFTVNTDYDVAVFEDSSNSGITIVGSDAGTHGIAFASNLSGNADGLIAYQPSSGTMFFNSNNVQYLKFNSQGVVVNDSGLNLDFRINAVGVENFVYSDNSVPRFGISNASVLPTDGMVHLIDGGSAGSVTASSVANTLVVESNAAAAGMTLICATNGLNYLVFGDGNSAGPGGLRYSHSTNEMIFFANSIDILWVKPSGVVVNEGGLSSYDFRHEADTSTHLLFSDATGTGRVSMSRASLAGTDGTLHIINGTAGTVTALTSADGVVIEDDVSTGLSILVPNDGSAANINMGAPTSGAAAGQISMVPSTGIMTITATQVNHSNNLGFAGRLDANTTTVTGTTHTAADEHVILVDDDTAGAAVTVTLPTAATADTIYHIKKLGSTANVTVDGNGAETIDGATTAVLTIQYESITVISDGSAWWVL